MTLSASSYRLQSGVRFRVIADEAVVLCQDTAEMLVLNSVASRMLELLSQGMPTAEIRVQLAEEYGVAPEEVGADLEELTRELEEGGVLRRAEQEAK